MIQDKIKEAAPIDTGRIIIFMILVFIITQIGFHNTYIQHFPEFENFTWLHHIHGALMASWVILLMVQPFLIYKGKFAAHRFVGKLSYVIAPVLIISIFLIAKFSYHKWIAKFPSEEVFSWQSITWMQFFMFVLFYSLAIFYKNDPAKHMRFMIGTAILMLGPGLNRIINAYFTAIPQPFNTIIPLYIKAALAALFLLHDIIKKKTRMPYTVVLLAFILAAIVYHARYSDAWQAFGRFVVNNLY